MIDVYSYRYPFAYLFTLLTAYSQKNAYAIYNPIGSIGYFYIYSSNQLAN